ncbi:hypothetical protein DSCA_40470 [Desulfosarcina alkanivorans]|uniref:Uncharacterized protein n=1 Tax=Desulfosarcina alkanivorans TaxID=571177 RepID=A0A5K7YZT0_9BACT|nr:hypothetical protein DSCA_40470 [Desulfosarcina alkanivorans]
MYAAGGKTSLGDQTPGCTGRNRDQPDLSIVVSAVGRLASDREVVLSEQVSGIVERYTVDVGARVAAGATLVQLDDTDYILALREAEANLVTARIRLPVEKNAFLRAQRLLPEKTITPELYDQAEAAYASAQATVTRLETLLAMARRSVEKTPTGFREMPASP